MTTVVTTCPNAPSWERPGAVTLGITTVHQAANILDEAQALNMQLVLRMNQGDWGWDGREFDMSIIEEMRPVFEHPALIGFYGLHEPLERFTLAEMAVFYEQFHETVDDPRVLLWHDIMRIPEDFTDGICDLCGVATNPHVNNRDGTPANDWTRTNPRLETARANMAETSHSTLCVLVQVYGGAERFRIPQPEEYQENMRRIVEEFDVRCLTNYSFYHNAYDQTLGDADQVDLQTAVFEMRLRYFE